MNHLYLHLFDPAQNGLHLHGLLFEEFLRAAGERLAGRPLLLLQHQYEMAACCPSLRLWYVPATDIPRLLQEDIFAWGPFSWIDAAEEEAMGRVLPTELAAILYLGHMTQPLHSPYFASLGNHFVYLSFQNGRFLRVYTRTTEDVQWLIARCLSAKAGPQAPALSADLSVWLFEQAQQGIWFDASPFRRHRLRPDEPLAVPYDRIGPWDALQSAMPPTPPRPKNHLLLTPQGWQRND